MSSVFGDQADKAVEAMEKETIKAVEFEQGLTLTFMGVQKQMSRFGGAAGDSSIVERNILVEGEEFLYTFKDGAGFVRKHYSTSFPLFIALQRAEINENDTLVIKREGKGKETSYSVEKVEQP